MSIQMYIVHNSAPNIHLSLLMTVINVPLITTKATKMSAEANDTSKKLPGTCLSLLSVQTAIHTRILPTRPNGMNIQKKVTCSTKATLMSLSLPVVSMTAVVEEDIDPFLISSF